MNQSNLAQIFQHYIDRFEYINSDAHGEYYKWQVCHSFPKWMNRALAAKDDDAFVKALTEAKKCTENIIDSYTQPFGGLVEIAKKDPEKHSAQAVRQLFQDLYADDGGDLKVQAEKIAAFFRRSNELLDEYFPGSFLYKQNSHSVSSYLFLYDPDHHYMYKAVQSQRFADCVEFYDDWGSGDNIKLDVYYRMCDELVAAIKECPELLETDKSRFDGRLKLNGGKLHSDAEKHILAFDIIYCCSVYDLFDGIAYTKRNLKEKQLYLEKKTKADQLKQSFEKAKADAELLDEALTTFIEMVSIGDKISHSNYGEGTVTSVDRKYLVADYGAGTKKISLPVGIANGWIKLDNPNFEGKVSIYREILLRHEKIPGALDNAAKLLEPYEEYL